MTEEYGALDAFFAVWEDARLEEWQKEPLRKIIEFFYSKREREQLFISITGANGTGKTSVMAWAILLALVILSERKKMFKGALYSGKLDQLKTNLGKDIVEWACSSAISGVFDIGKTEYKIKQAICSIQAKAWSTVDEHKVAGQHAEFNLFFIDEASIVPSVVFEELNSCTTDKKVLMLLTSNPEKNEGYVYDLYSVRPPHWILYRIAHTQLTFLRSKEFEERTKAMYGEESDVYRVQVLGEFPKFTSDAFIQREYLDMARERKPLFVTGVELKMGVDVASGESADFSTIVIRQGGMIWFAERRKCVLAELRIWIFEVCKKFNIKIFAIDEVGVSCGLYQELRDGAFPGIIGVNGAAKPFNKVRFYNRRAELFSEVKEWVMFTGSIPKHETFEQLVTELSLLEQEFRGTQLLIRSKKEMVKSPDFADALAYTFAVPDTRNDAGWRRRTPLVTEVSGW